ncbi:hypothetical protein I545_2400 [Mycobacterium kansasii 662]|uniref:Uncharacterized protein n=2 Tax=Mycobacterium kansasii TaxID=1768 RepID=A0A1V3XHQ5_MYCKA|nr:hypothetical protein I547_4286 [Mycobacterium kansasii 824]EUA19690.1 hypothetical protein I545_2400 [Mycobacterium kansasii 662]OOK78753.1 hypothetical protein BZL30_1747 [Mycobacterium kansasii]
MTSSIRGQLNHEFPSEARRRPAPADSGVPGSADALRRLHPASASSTMQAS